MYREELSRPCDKISALVHSTLTCGLEPLRRDFEIVVEQVKPGVYEMYSEAPHTDGFLKGMAMKATIRTYERRGKKYVALMRKAIFFPHTEDPNKDYYIVKMWDKGMARDTTPIFERILKKLEDAAGRQN
jgi:hypothetical protein